MLKIDLKVQTCNKMFPEFQLEIKSAHQENKRKRMISTIEINLDWVKHQVDLLCRIFYQKRILLKVFQLQLEV
jgi:hypothetical protein